MQDAFAGAVQVKVWALAALTMQVRPPDPTRSIRETSDSEKQREEMYSMWPPWEEEQMEMSLGTSVKSIFGGPDPMFNFKHGVNYT